MAIGRRRWLGVLPAVALVVGATGAAAQSPAAGEYDGVTVNVVTFSGPPIAEPLERYAPEFEAATGAKINITKYPFSDLYQKALTDVASGTNSFQLMTLAAPWVADFASAGYAADLTDKIANDPDIAWDDVMPFFRDIVAQYAGKVVGVPIDGDFTMTYYRTDILGADGVEPPKTWDEYLKIAEKYDGKDLNGDGVPDYGSCISKARSGVGTWLFNGVLSSFVQTMGTNQGTFFGDNMTPLINNEAMGAALDFWKASMEFGPPDENNLDQQGGRDMFTSGRCALAIDWGDTGVLAIDPATSKVIDKVGAVQMPGSTKVLDRATGKLVPCDATLCPYAIDGVNHSPFAAFGGWSAVVNAAADAKTQAAAYDFASYVSNPTRSNIDVTHGVTGMNPYRLSQFGDNMANWVAAGFSEAAATDYLGAMKDSLDNPNMAVDLRILQSNNYTNVAEDQAISQFLAGELTKEEAMQQLFDKWQELTDSTGRDAQAAAYAASLGVQR